MGKNENQSKDQYYSTDINTWEPKADCCIYRVPQFLRKVNEKAYTPRLISIGPLHYHCREDLMGMETHKLRYGMKFGERVGILKLRELETYISDQEQHIRNHYAVFSTLESSEYIAMILNDAVFIIELFVRNNCGTDDFLLDKSQLKTCIMIDLLLLENQIPYFVLNDLYLSAFPSSDGYPSFFTLCRDFFSTTGMFNWTFSEQPQFKHFTDVLRRAVVQEQPKVPPPYTETSNLPNATHLNERGLKFKSIKGNCLIEIKLVKRKSGIPLTWFDEAELEIPFIKINDDTECLLRNMMALEVFHYPTQTYVCNYADFMDYLINTGKDVDLLAEKGIIGNCIGDSEAIAKMFNTLCSRITPSPSYYYTFADDMKKHYLRSTWNRGTATLRNVYFTDLWTGTATGGAILLLILTVIQTGFSIKSGLQGNL